MFGTVFEENPVQPADTPLLGDDGAELPWPRPIASVAVEDPSPEERLIADQRRELEAERLAAVARRAVCEDGRPVRDRETGEVRPRPSGETSRCWCLSAPERRSPDPLGRARISFRHEGP